LLKKGANKKTNQKIKNNKKRKQNKKNKQNKTPTKKMRKNQGVVCFFCLFVLFVFFPGDSSCRVVFLVILFLIVFFL
jgi:quinol-cytochrome oxidoreductase complex cytochrome b subunit